MPDYQSRRANRAGSAGAKGAWQQARSLNSSILVPLDISALAQAAVPLALALGRRNGQVVELVHVHQPPPAGTPHLDPRFDRDQRAAMQRWLSTLVETAAREHEQAVRGTLLDGPVGKTLAEYVGRRPASLVVMATHGRGGLSRAWLGSVSDYMVRHADRPLLLLRPEPALPDAANTGGFRRVLVPLDGSKLSEQALEPALALGVPGETEYVLMTIVEPAELSAPSVMMAVAASEPASTAAALAEITELRRSVAEQYLALTGKHVGRQVVLHTHVAVHARPAQAILDYAAQTSTDLIAVATHGLGGPARLLVGSVADKVIRGASVPVLVVPPAHRGGAVLRSVSRAATGAVYRPSAD